MMFWVIGDSWQQDAKQKKKKTKKGATTSAAIFAPAFPSTPFGGNCRCTIGIPLHLTRPHKNPVKTLGALFFLQRNTVIKAGGYNFGGTSKPASQRIVKNYP